MNIQDLIAEVREHDHDASPAPWDLAWPTCVTTGGRYGDTIADGCSEEAASLIVCYRTAAPLLADEVERLSAENATLRANLKHVEHALGDRIKPGQTPERAIADLIADMDRMAAQLEDARLTLAADKGTP